MAVQVSYPGVYIDEFAPGAPIQGVSTNIAALIGVTATGDLAVPTRVTSWDQFKRVFGDEPRSGFYLWYAARGFFENGGNVAYIVRASNGRYDRQSFDDRGAAMTPAQPPQRVFRARARQPGVSGITSDVVARHLMLAASNALYEPTGALATQVGRAITLAANQAWQFRPGDQITIAAGGERRTVVRVAGNTLQVDAPFNVAYVAADPVRLANYTTDSKTVRVLSGAGVALPNGVLVPGTMLTLTQGTSVAAGIVDSVQPEFMYDAANALHVSYRVTFRASLGVAFATTAAATVQSEEFRIVVHQGGATVYDDLSIDSAHPNYYVRRINEDRSGLITIERADPPPTHPAPFNLPVAVAGAALAGGVAENLATIGDNDYIAALETTRAIDEISLVAIPDRRTAVVQAALIAHCEQTMDRFAVLDSQYDFTVDLHTDVENQRAASTSTRGYAALYYPWLRVAPTGSGDPVLTPPSGHVCGIIARSDAFKGVHKAPANEIVNGSVGVERRLNKTDHGLLNLAGINVIEQSGVGRPLLMGARTTASDLNWLHVSTRRLFLYLEESIEEGIEWAVFEPNNLQLWQKLKRSIGDFLTTEWRNGALFGKTAEEAFYVLIDERLNPFSEQQLGRLHIEIGVRPTYPAEFIIVRIGIWAGGSAITEG